MKHQKFETSWFRNLTGRLGLPLGVLGLSILWFGMIGAGCTVDLDDGEDLAGGKYALQSFYSCNSLDAYLTELGTDIFVRSYLYGYWGYGWRGGEPVPQAVDDQTNSGGEGSSSAPSEFTTTNVQEEDVDEPDLVKTDGNYLYISQDSVVHIIRSWPNPESAIEVSQVDLDGYGESIFLVGDRLVTFTSIWDNTVYGGEDRPTTPVTDVEPGVDEGSGEGTEAEPTPPEGGTDMNGTRITIIDVTDRTNPSVVRTIDIEGSFINARLVDGKVYVVLSTYPAHVPQDLWDAIGQAGLPEITYDMTLEQRQALEPQVRAMVEPIIADYIANGGRESIIPNYRLDEGEQFDLFSCTDVMRPANESDIGLLSVIGFDPNAVMKPRGVALLANGWTVYGSQSNLYIAQDSRWWFWDYDDTPYTETHVHKFALNDGDPNYLASGGVEGWVLNQFSMSEHKGYLRIATTDQTMGGWIWGPVEVDGGAVPTEGGEGASTSSVSEGSGEGTGVVEVEPEPEEPEEPPAEDANNVFVLQESEGQLLVTGQVRGIAPGEQIYAVRFLGNKGYVVTFEQVDPLFTLDLSDPANPQLVGELEITGFSTYMHPYDCDDDGEAECLLTIGRDADEFGRVRGLHLQLFDVSNLAAPVRLHQTVLSTGNAWSWSEAEHDHHAFTFYASHDLLTIPVSIEDWESNTHFSGIVAFRVSPVDGITEVGRVSHSLLAEDEYCGPEGRYTESECASWDYPWYVQMRRSVFIEEFMFAISNLGVTSNSVFDWDNILAIIPFF